MRVLSLGAGVQSSTIALMATHGELQVDHAIFADTQWEPKAVYDWLKWLKTVVSFPVHVVTAGSLREGALKISTQSRHVSLPYHVKGPAGDKQGLVQRQCTGDYKIRPIEKKVRELIGLKYRQRWPKTVCVEQSIGISLDEAHRMKPSQRDAIVHRFPLIDRRMTRLDCLKWMQAHGYPLPPKSSCIGCPFHSNKHWREMPPDEFQDAIDFERELNRRDQSRGRSVKSEKRGTLWLHRDRKPLDEVDLSPSDQTDMFGNECMGLCGT